MTNAEAIKIINQYDCNFYWTDGEKIPTEDLIEAFYLAVKALEAQEPRVLTLEEAEIFEDGWYWIEYQTIYQTSGIYHLRCHAIYPEGYDFDQPHSYIQMTEDDYGRYWRCWSARPTDEQREAVPWQD